MVINSFEDVEKVVNTNSFQLFELPDCFQIKPEKQVKCAALYQKISMINHSCEANCSRINLKDFMIIFASSPI